MFDERVLDRRPLFCDTSDELNTHSFLTGLSDFPCQAASLPHLERSEHCFLQPLP